MREMRIEISLPGEETFEVILDEDGRIELPQRKFTPAQLKKIAVAVNREMRSSRLKEEWT